jgi:hypothetical protein
VRVDVDNHADLTLSVMGLKGERAVGC